MELVVGIVSPFILVLCLAGTIGYKSLRRKWAGIIGVGGSYIVLIGVVQLVVLVAGLIMGLAGNNAAFSFGDIAGSVFLAVVCLLYTALIIFSRCETTAQRLTLPFAACMIACGFAWRLVFSIITHAPMDSGETASSSLDSMPDTIYDTNNGRATWRKQGVYGDHVDYCGPNGETVTFYQSDVEGENFKGFSLY